ncbi:MAG: class I SAM-dependent methyltransferase [Desulfocapsaceae bacterium]|nr:class I SAM-dependent methyltransferase [Desulfocapsaceae bacterium]
MQIAHQWKADHLVSEECCPLCGERSSTHLFIRPDGLPLEECTACRFVYLGVRPNETALEQYYAEHYFTGSFTNSTYSHYFDYAEAVIDLNYCPRLQRLEPFITQWQGKKVLEIGCAAGATLELLRRKGALVRGIEISAEAVAIARDHYHLDVSCAPFESFLLANQSYDVIMLFDVLEHLPEPRHTLDRLVEALVPGGFLVLTVPNFSCFDQVGTVWSGVQSYWEHLHYFRPDVLLTTLQQRGCIVTEIHSFTAAGQQEGKGVVQVITEARRLSLQKLIDKFPPLHHLKRLVRSLKFRLTGPPALPRSLNFSGMDMFCLVQKKTDEQV